MLQTKPEHNNQWMRQRTVGSRLTSSRVQRLVHRSTTTLRSSGGQHGTVRTLEQYGKVPLLQSTNNTTTTRLMYIRVGEKQQCEACEWCVVRTPSPPTARTRGAAAADEVL